MGPDEHPGSLVTDVGPYSGFGPYLTGGIESHQAVECRVEVRLIGDPPEAVGAIDVFEAFGLVHAFHMPYQCVRVLARPRSPGEGVLGRFRKQRHESP